MPPSPRPVQAPRASHTLWRGFGPIAGNIAAISDLYFGVERVLVDGDQVADRLVFDCMPQSEWLGLRPNGRSISFSERVFYKSCDGKKYEVRTLLDRSAIKAQLA